MFKRLFLYFAFLMSFTAYGQVEFGPRYEAIQENDNNAYLVIPNGDQGVVLVWTDYDPLKDVALLSLEFLDKDLKSQWTKNLEMPNRYLLKGYRYVDNKTYLLLESTMLDEVKVYRIDPSTGKVDRFLSTEIDEFIITKFEVLQNMAIIGGYIGDRAAVFAYDFKLNQLRALPKIFQNYSMLVEIKVNNDGSTFNVLTTTSSKNGDQTMLVNTFKSDGTPVRSYRVLTESNYQLVSGASSSFEEEGQVVVGLYGYKGLSPVSGIYVNRAQINGDQTIKYYDFTELPQFLKYLGEKGARKQLAKANKLKKGGKEPLFKLATMPQQLTESGDKLVFTGEFFRAYHKASSRNSNVYAGLPNPNLNDMYGHYSVLALPGDLPAPTVIHQAYALVLNQDGSIAWDDYRKLDFRSVVNIQESRYMSLEFQGSRITGFLRAVGNFHWEEEQGTYLYYFNKKLYVKKLVEGSNGYDKSFPLKLNAEGERILFDRGASFGTSNWYDNQYLVYGLQHVQPTNRDSPNRRVFFINKVTINKGGSGAQLD